MSGRGWKYVLSQQNQAQTTENDVGRCEQEGRARDRRKPMLHGKGDEQGVQCRCLAAGTECAAAPPQMCPSDAEFGNAQHSCRTWRINNKTASWLQLVHKISTAGWHQALQSALEILHLPPSRAGAVLPDAPGDIWR